MTRARSHNPYCNLCAELISVARPPRRSRVRPLVTFPSVSLPHFYLFFDSPSGRTDLLETIDSGERLSLSVAPQHGPLPKAS